MAVKRMATLLFLGSLTMLLLGALVYLAATGGGPERQPVPQLEGVELLRAGAGPCRRIGSRRPVPAWLPSRWCRLSVIPPLTSECFVNARL